VYVPPNRYMSDLSSLSEDQDILGEVESETCFTRSTNSRLSRDEKVRRRFRRRMIFLLPK